MARPHCAALRKGQLGWASSAPSSCRLCVPVGATTVVGPGGSRSRWASGSAPGAVSPGQAGPVNPVQLKVVGSKHLSCIVERETHTTEALIAPSLFAEAHPCAAVDPGLSRSSQVGRLPAWRAFTKDLPVCVTGARGSPRLGRVDGELIAISYLTKDGLPATSPIRISTCAPGVRMRIMRSRQPALPA